MSTTFDRRWLGVLLATACIAGLILGVRLSGTEPRVSGDTFWYARTSVTFTGATRETATADAARFLSVQRGDDAAVWEHVATTIDPRYPAIFAARPLYPLMASPFIGWLGLSALMAVSVAAGIAASLLVAAAAFSWTGSWAAGVIAGGLVTALPTGDWFAFMSADGLMLAIWAACLLVAAKYLQRGALAWLIGFLFGLAALYLTKPANGAVMAIVIVGMATTWSVLDHDLRGRGLRLAGACGAVAAGHLLLSPLLGFSGLGESLQDLATQHFSVPDVADPVGELIRRDGFLLASLPAMALADPLPIIIATVGLAAALVARGTSGPLWTAAGFGCAALVLLHPLPTEIPRLMAPVWLTVALGLAVALARGAEAIVVGMGMSRLAGGHTP